MPAKFITNAFASHQHEPGPLPATRTGHVPTLDLPEALPPLLGTADTPMSDDPVPGVLPVMGPVDSSASDDPVPGQLLGPITANTSLNPEPMPRILPATRPVMKTTSDHPLPGIAASCQDGRCVHAHAVNIELPDINVSHGKHLDICIIVLAVKNSVVIVFLVRRVTRPQPIV
jgi:hypothetical protein